MAALSKMYEKLGFKQGFLDEEVIQPEDDG